MRSHLARYCPLPLRFVRKDGRCLTPEEAGLVYDEASQVYRQPGDKPVELLRADATTTTQETE